MVKSEATRFGRGLAIGRGRTGGEPGFAGGFEEIECAKDVGSDEVAGATDRTIDMGFRGQVHDGGDLMITHDPADIVAIAEVDLFEDIFVMALESGEIFKMSGVSEAIEIDQMGDFGPVDDVANEIRADETGAAGDEEVHFSSVPAAEW